MQPDAKLYMEELEALRSRGYLPLDIAAAMRRRARQTARPVPVVALALEALGREEITAAQALKWLKTGLPPNAA